MAWTYVSRDVVAHLTHVSEENLQDEWSNWVEALIQEHMGYETIGTNTTITSEKHDGDGSNVLFVKKPPIISVTELKLGSTSPTALSSTAYKVYGQYVKLVSNPSYTIAYSNETNIFPVGTQNIEITYVSGLATVPMTVQLCAAVMIGEIAKSHRKGGADNTLMYPVPDRTQGQRSGVRAERGLLATLRSHMNNTLRKRVIPLG
jgi:hypothetical protein